MKNCPVCSEEFIETDYEGETVLRCRKCRGAFLPRYRLEIIKHKQARTDGELKAEAKDEFSSDTKDKLRCPRCNGKMQKKPIDGRFAALTLDHCKTCDWIWLDGGELALVQLFYASSAQAASRRDMQQRVNELEASPERKADFDKAFAELPEDLPGADAYEKKALAVQVLATALRIIGRF